MNCVIFDLDGTLADCRHRLHHVTGGYHDWPAFFADMGDDPSIEPVRWLASILQNACQTIYVSGRPEAYRLVTQAWLVRQSLHPDHLYMRPDNDTRPDHVVKLELLERIRADGYRPVLVIDDRPSVVEMWRAQGLVCLQNAYVGQEVDPRLAGKELLHLMVGPSGAGKTAWLEAETLPREQRVLSSDDMRRDLLGDMQDQTQNQRVFEAVHDIARAYLKHGLVTWIDATHLRRKDRMAAAALAPAGTIVTYHVVDRPLASKLAYRGWRPEELVRKHDQMFRSQVKDIMSGDDLPNVRVHDCRRMKEAD